MTEQKEAVQQVEFQIQRIYMKDVSFECPNSPAIFQKEWAPQVSMNLDTKHTKLENNQYEVVLSLTATAKIDDETAFLCEVHQAGIFLIADLEDMASCLNAFCPNILFPYAREAITNLVTKGTFPQLNLAPINFDALFQQAVQNNAQNAKGTTTEKLDS